MKSVNSRAACRLAGLVLLLSGVAHGQTEIGPDDFRISSAGPNGDPLFDATHDGSAYNSMDDQYLVVWDADTVISGVGPTFNGKREVFGRLLNGDGGFATGEQLLATRGPSSDEAWDAQNPEVAYNSVANEYYLVFVGTVEVNQATAQKTEIFGLRVNRNGDAIGAPVRLSQTGNDSNLRLDSREPSLAYNPQTNQMLVVWQRELVDDGSRVEHEIYARLVNANGTPTGNAIRVSTMGPNGNTAYDALDPFVAYGSGRNEFLVTWRGDDNRSPLVQGEFEVFGQRIAADGIPTGPDDFRISQMGPNRNPSFDASDPAIAYNPDLDEFMVTWTGIDQLNDGEEVFAQLVRSDGTAVGSQIQVSTMGSSGPTASDWVVDESLVSYNPASAEYFVIWIGEDDRALLAIDEFEVFGQRLDPDGLEIGLDDARLSTLGPDGSSRYDPFSIDLAYNSRRNEYLVVFSGDDNPGSLTDDEVEIFGQRVAPRLPTCLPDTTTLCLAEGRFKVTLDWRTNEETGRGQANSLTQDSGWFWFFNQENSELVVKVLDARVVNGNFWVFFGALSDVEYVLTVQDTETGEEREYRNEQDTLASLGDTAAFPLPDAGLQQNPSSLVSIRSTVGISAQSSTAQLLQTLPLAAAELPDTHAGTGSCEPSSTAQCLSGDRFRVEIEWATNQGTSGVGQAVDLSTDTGWFWFFDSANTEVMVKVLDARVINNQFWVFFGSLSNVEFTLTVTDTETGSSKSYFNPHGTFASVGDTSAFPGS